MAQDLSQPAATLPHMKTIDLWRWVITDDTGRRRPTRHRMTEADALAQDPTAERLPGTLEQRQVPDKPDERDALRATPAPRR